jgi:toluene monooxygenase system protein E
LQIAWPGLAALGQGRQIWETHAAWQPARKAIETSLIAYDWAECLTAVNLILRPALDEVLLGQLASVARENGDELAWLLLTNLANDSLRASRWSTALARFAIERNPDNIKSLVRWADKWTARADEAVAGLAGLLATLPEPAQDEHTTIQAGRAAVARSLASAGIKPALA